MGLIKAGIGALGGTLADQWKEFFYCESMPKEVLVTKGQKRVSGRSSNTKGNDNSCCRWSVHDYRGTGQNRGSLRRTR